MANESLRNALRRKKAKGIQDVSIEEIEALMEQEDAVQPVQIARLEMENQRKLLIMQAAETAILETQIANFKAIIDIGQSTLKSLIVISGGAVVTFIAFFNAHLLEFIKASVWILFYKLLIAALFLFGVSVVLACFGVGCSYFAQWDYQEQFNNGQCPKIRKWAQDGGELKIETKFSRWHKGAILCAFASVVLMLLGVGLSAWGFWQFFLGK